MLPCNRGASNTVSFDDRAEVKSTRSPPLPWGVLSLCRDNSVISLITCQREFNCNQRSLAWHGIWRDKITYQNTRKLKMNAKQHCVIHPTHSQSTSTYTVYTIPTRLPSCNTIGFSWQVTMIRCINTRGMREVDEMEVTD